MCLARPQYALLLSGCLIDSRMIIYPHIPRSAHARILQLLMVPAATVNASHKATETWPATAVGGEL